MGTPAITVNSTPTEIAAANAASQTTPTPGSPAPVVTTTPAAPATPTPENPVVVNDLGGGRFEAQYLSGEKFEGTATEVIGKVGQAHVSTKLWAQNEVAKAQQPVPVVPTTPSPFATPEEQAAAEYATDLVAKNFGYADGKAMKAALGNIQDNTTDFASQNTSIQFMAAQPDFNPTSENSEKLLNVISQSGLENAFQGATRPQQINMLKQAHAFCIMNKVYEPKPVSNAAPRVPPPPAAPVGSRPNVQGGQLPPELIASASDTLAVIKDKWDKAKALGYDV